MNQLFKCDLLPYEIKVKDLKVRYICYLNYTMQLIKNAIYDVDIKLFHNFFKEKN